MANPMVVNLNFRNTIAEQDNKCIECGKDIDPDKQMFYFRMDQRIHLYEVYCEICGIEQEKIDKSAGKKIEKD